MIDARGLLIILIVVACPAAYADIWITSIAPDEGADIGGTYITITGQDFTQDAAVVIGGEQAMDVAVVSSTEITCETPPGQIGAADVTVTTSAGSCTLDYGFTYLPPEVILTLGEERANPGGSVVIPVEMESSGGSQVTVVSFHILFNNDLVRLNEEFGQGGAEAGPALLASDKDVAVNSLEPGRVIVLAVGFNMNLIPDGVLLNLGFIVDADVPPGTEILLEIKQVAAARLDLNSSIVGGYDGAVTVVQPLVIEAVQPEVGPTTGSTLVTIVGRGFEPDAIVFFDDTMATEVQVVSSTGITCVAPAHAEGVVDVSASQSNGESTLVEGFAYVAARPDVNGDGFVNAIDVQLVINEALEIDTGYDYDINGDGTVNALDVQLVINAALGIV